MSRCTGHCCRRFPLPEPLEEIRARQAGTSPKPKLQDGDFIADMLIPLGTSTYRDGRTSYLFTCRHHDVTSGDCMVYDQRPIMCSTYPYGKPCPTDGCTAPNRGVLVPLRSAR